MSKEIKDKKCLEKELLELNPKINNYDIFPVEQINRLKNEYVFNTIDDIKNEFNNNLKGQLNTPINQNKLKCLMIYANKILFKYEPRDIQLIALDFFINKKNNEGLIQEIKTGEGKSLIITFLAAYNNLVYNKKVDILTSSIILAERDCHKYKDFYNIFNITTDFCRDEIDKNNKYKICYSADILYGDCLSFEADILRTNFLGVPGKNPNRNFECIIIDEIDNICIDNIKNLTELLDDFPGYKSMEYIYIYIYQLLIELDKKYNRNEIIIQTKKEEIISELTNKFEKFLDENKKNNFELVYYPTFLHDYILLRKKEWCRNAFEAKYEFKKNKEYTISKDESGFNVIKPIDYYNTGIIQQNSVWPGLHQFLELKEGLNLTPENLNSCYMSNLTFIKKYKNLKGNNIYGLTGTVGSKETQKALHNIYNMNFIIIPTYKPTLFKQLSPTILNNYSIYEETIVKHIIEYSKTRAVLVIFEYIANIKEIKKKLNREDSIDNKKIIIYKDSENLNESLFLKNNINVGDIILSTNLAARGTDITISEELEKNGGLHVILTYFPNTERVEKQALGRAGRKGENGSGELIIYSNESNIDKLIKERDNNEIKLYNQLMNDFSIRDELYENLFNEFCELLSFIKNSNIETKNYYLLDYKEKWGFFLIKNNINNVNGRNSRNKEVIEFNFKKLKKELINIDFQKVYKFRNPLIESNNIKYENLERIVNECTIYSIGAAYFIIYLLIQSNQSLEYIKKYINLLEERIQQFIYFYNNYIKNNIKYIREYENSQYNDIEQQINEKLQMFQILLENVTLINNNIINHKNYSDLKLKITNKCLLKDLGKEKGIIVSKNTINYFYDLGIYFLYETDIVKTSCCFI